MIYDEAGLAVSRKALDNIQGAFECLRRDLMPINERRFHLWSQADLGLIFQIRDEIDEYVGLKRLDGYGTAKSMPGLTDELVAETRKSLAHLEAALDSMRLAIKPKNDEWYRVISRPCIDLILEIRDRIDAHLGIRRPIDDDPPTTPRMDPAPNAVLETAHAG